MSGWLYIGLGIISVIIGNILIKFSHGFEKLGLGIAALIVLTLCNICFGMAVKTLPLGIAYAVWMGVVSVGIVLASRFIFDEQVSLIAGFLMLIIISCAVGLIFVTKSAT